jgi:hypothetical protein
LNTVINSAQLSNNNNSLIHPLNSSNIVCQETTTKLDSGAIAAISILSTIVFMVLIATLYDLYLLHKRRVNFASESTNVVILPLDINEEDSMSETQSLLVQSNTSNEEACCSKFITSLSLIKSGRRILDTSITLSGELNCLHSIRFLSIAWIILGHSYLLSVYFSNDTTLFLVMVRRLSFQLVINGTFSVDSFFLMSGLLTCFTFMKELSKRNTGLTAGYMIKYYVHRFWRLSPPYYAMLMFSLLLTKYLGSGNKKRKSSLF